MDVTNSNIAMGVDNYMGTHLDLFDNYRNNGRLALSRTS